MGLLNNDSLLWRLPDEEKIQQHLAAQIAANEEQRIRQTELHNAWLENLGFSAGYDSKENLDKLSTEDKINFYAKTGGSVSPEFLEEIKPLANTNFQVNQILYNNGLMTLDELNKASQEEWRRKNPEEALQQDIIDKIRASDFSGAVSMAMDKGQDAFLYDYIDKFKGIDELAKKAEQEVYYSKLAGLNSGNNAVLSFDFNSSGAGGVYDQVQPYTQENILRQLVANNFQPVTIMDRSQIATNGNDVWRSYGTYYLDKDGKLQRQDGGVQHQDIGYDPGGGFGGFLKGALSAVTGGVSDLVQGNPVGAASVQAIKDLLPDNTFIESALPSLLLPAEAGMQDIHNVAQSDAPLIDKISTGFEELADPTSTVNPSLEAIGQYIPKVVYDTLGNVVTGVAGLINPGFGALSAGVQSHMKGGDSTQALTGAGIAGVGSYIGGGDLSNDVFGNLDAFAESLAKASTTAADPELEAIASQYVTNWATNPTQYNTSVAGNYVEPTFNYSVLPEGTPQFSVDPSLLTPTINPASSYGLLSETTPEYTYNEPLFNTQTGDLQPIPTDEQAYVNSVVDNGYVGLDATGQWNGLPASSNTGLMYGTPEFPHVTVDQSLISPELPQLNTDYVNLPQSNAEIPKVVKEVAKKVLAKGLSGIGATPTVVSGISFPDIKTPSYTPVAALNSFDDYTFAPSKTTGSSWYRPAQQISFDSKSKPRTRDTGYLAKYNVGNPYLKPEDLVNKYAFAKYFA